MLPTPSSHERLARREALDHRSFFTMRGATCKSCGRVSGIEAALFVREPHAAPLFPSVKRHSHSLCARCGKRADRAAKLSSPHRTLVPRTGHRFPRAKRVFSSADEVHRAKRVTAPPSIDPRIDIILLCVNDVPLRLPHNVHHGLRGLQLAGPVAAQTTRKSSPAKRFSPPLCRWSRVNMKGGGAAAPQRLV